MALGDAFDGVLDAARTGADDAWRALYRELGPAILGYLRARGALDPEDLTGEVFANVLQGLPRFSGNERDFRAWVLTIAHRRLVDQRRRRTRRIPEGPGSVGLRVASVGDAEDDALERLGTRRVRELIAHLSPDQQDVLLLRILGDLTVDEVARALDKTPTAVKALQRRAIARLRREIVKAGVSL